MAFPTICAFRFAKTLAWVKGGTGMPRLLGQFVEADERCMRPPVIGELPRPDQHARVVRRVATGAGGFRELHKAPVFLAFALVQVS